MQKCSFCNKSFWSQGELFRHFNTPEHIEKMQQYAPVETPTVPVVTPPPSYETVEKYSLRALTQRGMLD